MDLKQLESYLGMSSDGQAWADPEEMDAERRAQWRAQQQGRDAENPSHAAPSVADKLKEIEMAARLGYLLCQCSWPPQIMVLSENSHVFRCPSCQRLRDF